MYLSVIIPAYNEEKRLPETLKKVRDYLISRVYEWEILIVNDGSKDKTAEVVLHTLGSSPFASGHPSHPSLDIRQPADSGHRPRSGDVPSGSFRLIDNKENKGKGAVVKQGMLEAQGEWRLFMDADNSTDISEIEKLLNFANPKSQIPTSNQISNSKSQNLENCDLNGHCDLELDAYDIIIGSRYLKTGLIKIKQPLIRRVISRFGNWLIRILLGINMADTQCGFKLFSAKSVQDIFPKQTIMRWGFDMEILAIAKYRGYQIKEVAVDWYDAEGSTVKKSAALKTLKELLIIKWNLMRGKYS